MIFLLAGFLLFLGVHLIPKNSSLRDKLTFKYGQNRYRATYSLISVTGLGLMYYSAIINEQRVTPIFIELRNNSSLIMFFSIFLITSSFFPKIYLRKFIKNPLVSGVLLWSLFHFLTITHEGFKYFFIGLFIFNLSLLIKMSFYETKNKKLKLNKFDFISFITSTFSFFLILYIHKFLTGVNIWPY